MNSKRPLAAIIIETILACTIMGGLLFGVFLTLQGREIPLDPIQAKGKVSGDKHNINSTEMELDYAMSDSATTANGTDSATTASETDPSIQSDNTNSSNADDQIADWGANNKKNKDSKTDENAPEMDAPSDESSSTDFICEFSMDRLLTEEDWASLENKYTEVVFPDNRNLAQMMINEIYARKGYVFKEDQLTNYFANKSWYQNRPEQYNNMKEVTNMLSDEQLNNVLFLRDKM